MQDLVFTRRFIKQTKNEKNILKNNLEAYFKWIQKETLTPFEACLNFVYKTRISINLY